jgi:hypothetical protein
MAGLHRQAHANQDLQNTLAKSEPVLIGFLLIAAYFLFAEHRAHVIAFLPYLLLLACPLMHIFMHGGHGGHHGHSRAENDIKAEKGEA